METRTPILDPAEQRFRVLLVTLASGLFSVFVIGLFTLITSPLEVVTLGLAYSSGLSMIVLPCTLPAVFVIVPLAMGRAPRRAVLMAGLFGLGLTVTITAYGAIVAAFGKVFYLDQVTMGMWLVAGSAAYLFGLSELGLLRFSPPSYEGPMPRGLDRQGDYVRAFGLGLLLGNAGIGCPNPAFYVLLTYLAGSGSVITGLAMGGIHGIGRATPLLAVAALAILGVNATGWLVSRREAVQRGTGWALVALGALLVGKPLFGHAWWEESVFHKVWNGAVHWALGANVAESAEAEALLGATLVTDPWALYGPWVFLGFVIALPILWDYARRLRELPAGGDHARQPIS